MATRIRRKLLTALAVLVASTLALAGATPAHAAATATLTGYVFVNTTPNRAPAGAVVLTAERWDGATYVTTAATTQTGANGIFTFTGFEAGRYRLSLSGTAPATYVSKSVVGIEVADGATVDTGGIQVLSYRPLSGTVLLPGGAPVPAGDAVVTLQTPSGGSTGFSATVGDGGSFAFSVPPASYRIVADYVGSLAVLDVVQTITVSALGADPAPVSMSLARSYSLSGRIVHEDGTPVAFATVSSSNGPLEFTTDESGQFAFSDLPAGIYHLTFGGPDGWVANVGRTITLTADTDVTGLEVTLPDVAGLSGRVTDSDGRPLAGIQVTFINVGSFPGFYPDPTSTITDADGYYELRPRNLYVDNELSFVDPAGLHAITYWDGLSEFYLPPSVPLQPGVRLQDMDVVMPRVSSIAGVVSGQGLTSTEFASVRAELFVFDYESGSWVQTHLGSNVDSSGAYRIAGLFPDYYRVGFFYNSVKGYGSAASPMLVVDEGVSQTFDARLDVVPGLRPDTAAFVRALYADFLDREPASSELQHWGGLIQTGFPRGNVSSGFVNSDEYRLIRIDAAYEDILGRPSESGGRMSWLNGMKAGALTTDGIEQSLFVSQEYFNRQGGTNRLFVEALYEDLLHRTASDAEASGWTADLNAGRITRGQIISIFWRSLETARERVAIMWLKYFGVPGDYASIVYWGDFNLAHGDSAVRSALTGSQQYWDNAQSRY